MRDPGRFHLTLAVGDRVIQHGWWQQEATARDKYRRWIGAYGNMASARVTLSDKETGRRLTTWPYPA